MSALSWVQTLLGGALLLAPRFVLASVGHERIDRPAVAFARVLGARHLLQVAVMGRRPARGRTLAGAAVDAIHASTMAGLAVARADRRRFALANAAVASALAVAGVREARSEPR